jgi:hypothetical protein
MRRSRDRTAFLRTDRYIQGFVDQHGGSLEPLRFSCDSAHIAVASINGLDCVLSYNFQHINRLKTKMPTERVNHREGYSGIVICDAKEVLDNEHFND